MASPDTVSNDPTTARTFPQLVRAAAAAYGDDVAITLQGDAIPSESVSFNDLDRKSAELARGLIAQGIGKGARIGFIHGNGPSFAIAFAGICRAGAVAVPISTLIKSNELVRVLRQSDIGGLIVQRKLLGHDLVDRLCDALPALRDGDSPDLRLPQAPYLRWIAVTGDAEALPPTIRGIAHLTAGAESVSDELLVEVESEIHTTDQMVEIYTSGSMAAPKGVKHNHGPMMFRTHYLRSKSTIGRGMTGGAPMPMFWVGGMMLFLMPNWEVGATTACTEGTSTDSRMAMGSVLAKDDMEAMAKGPINWALGMSETIGPYSYGDEVRAPGYPVCAPIDHAADGYEIRVADENDQPVGDGETGEVQVRGYPVAAGLHKIEREGYYTADGYYHTGDMGLVEGNRIHFVGRNGDMIKTNGSNVSPAEVEMEMQALPGVHSAYVVGLPDAERGQLVVAAVVARDDATLDFDEVQKTLRKNLSSFKVPRAYVEITRAEVPMLPSNKVARRQIATMMAERLGRA